MQDAIKITGVFECKVFENGKLIQEYKDDNLVVDLGKTEVANLLRSGSSAMFPLNKIGFGTDATAPAVGDTGLTATVLIKPITGSSSPTPTSVKYDWFLGNAEHNGNTIREFGLMGTNDAMFARKTGLVVVKNITITLTGSWTITIT